MLCGNQGLCLKNTKKPTLTPLSPLTHSLRSILVDDGVLITIQLLRRSYLLVAP